MKATLAVAAIAVPFLSWGVITPTATPTRRGYRRAVHRRR
jgi:hypothetical protein